LRVSEGQFDEFPNLCHLLPATTNVVVANLVQVALLVLALNGVTLTMNDGVLSNNAVLRSIDFDDLEFDLSHGSSDGEEIALSDRSIGFAEVWGEEDIEEGASQAFDGVCNGKDSNALGLRRLLVGVTYNGDAVTHVFNVGTRVNGDDVAVLDSQIVANHAVDASTAVVEIVICEHDQDCVLSLLALHQDGVSSEELEGFHSVV
jgi:hypothetical protein